MLGALMALMAARLAAQTSAPRPVAPAPNASIEAYLPKLDALRKAGDWPAVEHLARQALQFLRPRLGPDAADIATADMRLAEALDEEGQHAAAESLLRQSLEIDEKGPDPVGARTLEVLDLLGSILYNQGRYAETETLARRMLSINEKTLGPNSVDAAQNANAIGELLIGQGRYKEAEPFILRAMNTLKKVSGPDDPLTVLFTANLAALLGQQGRYGEAEPMIRESLARDEKTLGPQSERTASDVNNLGMLLQREERYAESELLMRRALAIDEKTLGPENRTTIEIVNHLGFLLLEEGHYSDAEANFRRALAVQKKILGLNHPDTLSTQIYLANALADQNRDAEAERLQRQTVAATEKSAGKESLAAGTADANLATTLSNEGRYREANILFLHASIIYLETLRIESPDTLQITERLARNEFNLGEFDDATANYRVVCSYLAARRSLELNSIALHTERTATGDCSSQLALSLWSWASKGGGEKPTDRPDALKLEAFFAIQRSLQSAGGFAMSHSAALTAATAAGVGPQAQTYDSALQERDELDSQFSKVPSDRVELRASLTASRTQVSAKIAQLATELRTKAPLYWNYRNPKLVSIAELQSKSGADAMLLHDDEALIVFMAGTGGDKGLVFAVSKEQAAWARIGMSGDELTAAVTKLRRQIDPEGYGLQQAAATEHTTPGAFDRQAAFALYQQLLGDASIQEVIKSKPTWIFAPSGSLTSLPPGLLVTSPPAGGRAKDTDPGALRATAWLLRSKAVALLPAVTALRTLREFRSADHGKTPDPLLAFADPDFTRSAAPKPGVAITAARGFKTYFRDGMPLAEALGELPRLPGTRAEGEALERVMQGKAGSLLMGKDASKAQLMARNKDGRLSQVQVLEFATHGLVAGDASDLAEPALVLAAGNTPQDELLLASEAATLHLNAEWVLLSACNTASPDAPEAQGLSGLSRAFFYAGARSLLISHWRVRDDVAPVLIPAMLLAERQHPDLSHAQSLQQASLAVLDNTSINAADPSAWAAFTLIGEPRR
jgi:CHAT domain-containing protein